MAPNTSEDTAPREGGVKPIGQSETKPSRGSMDNGDRGEVQGGGIQGEREKGERQSYDKRVVRVGERGASIDRFPRERKGQGQHDFYGGPPPHPRDMPIGYGHERMYGYGRMGRPDYGSPGRPLYQMDFGRFPSESRKDFGGYNRGCGEPFRPPFRPEQWGYGDRYRGRHDRSRRGDYYGMGPSSRRGYSCAPSGYRNGPQGLFQPIHQSRYGYPGCYN